MASFLSTVLWFVLALGLLVAVHEWGHFQMARFFGIRVLRFSIGFGKAWWRWTDKRGTEFVLSTIPLGGYVKLLDAREGEVDPDLQAEEFSARPVHQRLWVYVAGPLINLIFAVLLYWGLAMWGSTTLAPIIGSVVPDTPAAVAGVAIHQEVLAVDDQPTNSWEAVSFALADRIGETGVVRLTLRPLDINSGAQTADAHTVSLSVSEFMAKAKPGLNPMQQLGIEPYWPVMRPVIGEIVTGGAADKAGLRVGDEIVQVGDQPLTDWGKWVEIVRSHPQQALDVTVVRGAERLQLEVIPEAFDVKQDDATSASGSATSSTASSKVKQGRIGAQVQSSKRPDHLVRTHSAGIVDGFVQALTKTTDIVLLTFTTLGKMLNGLIGLDNLNGPIAIAQFAGTSAQYGVIPFIEFLAYLSIGLGVFNILPVPVLDGGHVLFALIEWVRGKPLSERIQQMGLNLGIAVLSVVMLIAFYNDVMRLIP